MGSSMTRVFHKVSSFTFFAFGSQFGAISFREWNSDCSGYVYSRLNYRSLINLSITSMVASRSLKFIRFFSSRKLKFLYFLNEGFMNLQPSLRLAYKRFWKFNFYIVNHWIAGVLTNYKIVRGKLIKFKSRTNFTHYANGFIFLDNLRYLNISSAEARSSKLPSIGLVDVDVGFSPFVYSIPSNNKAFSIFFSFYCLFFRASETGWFSWNVICGNFFVQQTRRVFSKLLHFSRISFSLRFSDFTKNFKLIAVGSSKFNFDVQIQQNNWTYEPSSSHQLQSYQWFVKNSRVRFDLLGYFNYGLKLRNNIFGFLQKKRTVTFKQHAHKKRNY